MTAYQARLAAERRDDLLSWLAAALRQDGIRARAAYRAGRVVVRVDADWLAIRERRYGYWVRRGMIEERGEK